jgi:hypothetical protein
MQLGYGDSIAPSEKSKLIAAAEAILAARQ